MIVFAKPTGTPVSSTHLQLPHLIDIDGSNPQWVQKPTIRVEIRNPRTNQVIVLHSVDSMVRQNSFSQRSQTCDIVCHDVADWTHPNGFKAIHSMYGVRVYEGYRGVMVQTFHGWVTEADYTDFPYELRLACSDILYLADQFFILSPLTYESWAAEDAFRDIMCRAGIPESYINIGADGTQTVPYGLLPATDLTKGKAGAVFAYETGMSALGHLCDEFGYHLWADVHGRIEVQLARPFPTALATMLPVISTNGVPQKRLSYLSAPAAQAAYSNSALPGNLIKVISHKFSCHDMRNFIQVTDGFNTPINVSAAPAVAGFPPPHIPTPRTTDPTVLAATHNAALPTVAGVPVFTSSVLVATDLISWTDTVLQDPTDPSNLSTTDMPHYLASRILADLNHETESLEVLGVGNPYVDIGQTFKCTDLKSAIDGVFFINGYQTRISSAGYTTQITGVGGTPRSSTYPRPRPAITVRVGHDAVLRGISFFWHGHLQSISTTAAAALALSMATAGS